ncbi:hypothetical protein [Pedobacter xixiisoli]|uniref:Uncharacterized protein n=1 Tax=Pedobacter xixiisoli TaxID=1476464 RepID=A0A286A731_9SPHI|nr:hypothetical protein [Pedobacter xixiisoli]SOD17697.1 hypothetical protein SAMN06297358_2642 [Pedobacter xixiisoli]
MTNFTEDHYDFMNSYSAELKELLVAAAVFPNTKTLQGMKDDIFVALMARIREELLAKLEQVNVYTANYPHSKPIITMLTQKLTAFLDDEQLIYRTDFYRRIVYRLELVSKLERIDWNDHDINVYPPVDELLIYMNYNSKTYTKHLENWLAKRIEDQPNPKAKIEQMNFYKKVFSQLHIKPETILYENYPPLTELITRWFQYEAEYLDSELELFKQREIDQIIEQNEQLLVELGVSADILGLLLRAAIDAGVIVSKSMTSAFKEIVSKVRTKAKDRLSPQAVRTRSYGAETVDKEIARSILKKMDKLIDGY